MQTSCRLWVTAGVLGVLGCAGLLPAQPGNEMRNIDNPAGLLIYIVRQELELGGIERLRVQVEAGERAALEQRRHGEAVAAGLADRYERILADSAASPEDRDDALRSLRQLREAGGGWCG